MAKSKPTTTQWAIIFKAGYHIVPYTGPEQPGLLYHCTEGDKTWTKVAEAADVRKKDEHESRDA